MTEINAIKELFPPLNDDYIPRGYLGEIIKWASQGGKLNYATQVGISIMSFCACRRYYSPSMSPVHLYTVSEGPGATGKKQVSNALIKLMTDIGHQNRIGPTLFRNNKAFQEFLGKIPRNLTLLSKLVNLKYMRSFIDYWSDNEDVFLKGGKYLFYPSPVLVLRSLTNEFKSFLTREEYLKGTAERLLVFRETKSGVDKFVAEYDPIDTSVIASLKKLALGVERDDPRLSITPVPLKWADEKTSNLYEVFREKMIDLCSKSDVHEASYGEISEMMARIATLSALGRDSMTIDETDVSFATNLVLNSSNYVYQVISKN